MSSLDEIWREKDQTADMYAEFESIFDVDVNMPQQTWIDTGLSYNSKPKTISSDEDNGWNESKLSNKEKVKSIWNLSNKTISYIERDQNIHCDPKKLELYTISMRKPKRNKYHSTADPGMYPHTINYAGTEVNELNKTELSLNKKHELLRSQTSCYDRRLQIFWVYNNRRTLYKVTKGGDVTEYDNIHFFKGHPYYNYVNGAGLVMVVDKYSTLHMIGGDTADGRHYAIKYNAETSKHEERVVLLHNFSDKDGDIYKPRWMNMSYTINKGLDLIYVIGGATGHRNGSTFDEIYKYHVDNNKWTKVASMPRGLQSAGVALLDFGEDILGIFGGIKDEDRGTGRIYVLDLNTKIWRKNTVESRLRFDGPSQVISLEKYEDKAMVKRYVAEQQKVLRFGGSNGMPQYLTDIIYTYQRQKRIYLMSEATNYLHTVNEDELFDNLTHCKISE